MNINSILDNLKVCDENGRVVTTEESIILHNSLLILQAENHFTKIFFWGKIYGTDRDYYIAFGYQKDALKDRIYYYSTNCTDWGLLPKPSDYAKKLTPYCYANLFQGDPAIVSIIRFEKEETTIGCTLSEPMVKKLKEEDRLSATLYRINDDAIVAPRGGLFRGTDGIVVENKEFYGLDDLNAREITSFLHVRKPTRKWNSNLLTRDDYNHAMDFLDPLDVDMPERCWNILFTENDTMVCLRSLYWPGAYFYHRLKTPRYGSVYFGYGMKTIDVPFLICNMEIDLEDLKR